MHKAPSCPRCGYDLSGQAASWTDHCPISGTCPECGAGHDWPEVFNNALTNERFVEHARGAVPTVVAAVRTWLWTLWPPLFWKRIDPVMPARPLRWVVWLLVIVLVPRLLVGLLEGAASLSSINRGLPSSHPVPEVTGAVLNGILGPVVSVGMEPIAAVSYSAPGVPGVPIRANIFWGFRIPSPVSGWIHDHQTPPALPVMLVLTIAAAVCMRILWKVWGHPRAQGFRFWRLAVYGLSWLVVLNWLDVYSASGTLLHSFDTPISAPQPLLAPSVVTLLPAIHAWGLSRPSTMISVIEDRAGLWVLLVGGGWIVLWWWFAARAGLTGHPPRRSLVGAAVTIVIVTVSALLWNYDGVARYWNW